MLSVLTLEILLKRYANGGAMIVARSFFTGLLIYALVTWLGIWLSPAKAGSTTVTCWMSSTACLTLSEGLKSRVYETLPWLGAVVGGIYAILYSRFASQWSYLSGVYHQIKETECTGCARGTALAEWKAAFIEDCDEVHLARKPTFAAIISTWGHLEAVRDAFHRSSPGGRHRLRSLLLMADCVSDLDENAKADDVGTRSGELRQ